MTKQILLIDDSKAIHQLLTSLLAEEPVKIHSAFDAEFGIGLAASLRPDLILLDVDMPVVDGYETCRRLKSTAETASLPIIFLTAKASTEEMVRGLDLGACDYVTKPFKLSELLSRVRAALRTGHLIRLLEDKALLDSLTGLGTRAMFDSRLAAEVALRVRSGGALSCVALEIEGFEEIDQKYGPAFGDQVLSKIGEQIHETCRPEDVACRFRRSSFCILSPRTTALEAETLAQKVSSAISATRFARQNISFALNCRFAVTSAQDPYDRALLQRAEQALSEGRVKPKSISLAIELPPYRPAAA
jgi:diguanylate cyclase (GGDEF)-like protein